MAAVGLIKVNRSNQGGFFVCVWFRGKKLLAEEDAFVFTHIAKCRLHTAKLIIKTDD